MTEKYSLKFWIFFWSLAAVFLAGWFLFWNIRHKGIAATSVGILNVLPLADSQKNEFHALISIGDFLLKKDDKEKTLMLLFQNNMEIRPGGGFIGAFGIVGIKNGKVVSMETHDLSNFDSQIPNDIAPPYPLAETGVAKFWKLRDSNFSPDFATNAEKAEEFYRLGQGQQKFDGVIGITTNVLTSILKITGPIAIEGYPGTYDSNNAVMSLEYQVEKAFEQQGIDRGERKSVMSDLFNEIEKRVFSFSLIQKMRLAKTLLSDLNQKDIQLNFKNASLQNTVVDAAWAGEVDRNWNKDFLMTSDANLGSFKSDYYVKRSFDYTIDLTKDEPLAKLRITYQHTAKQKDWMTRNYTDYLRVYVPENSKLVSENNFDDMKFGKEFGKDFFGAIVQVPIGESKTVEIVYSLPQSIKEKYELKIQKQAGINDESAAVHIINIDGSERYYKLNLRRDIILNY